MDVEVVHHQMPKGFRRISSQERGQVLGEVRLGASRAEAVADRSAGHIEIGNQSGGA